MKRFLYSSLAVISVFLLVLSCAKESNEFESINEGGIQVTINAGKAALKPSTKTEIVGTTPYWSVGDKIGVSNGTTSNASFSTGIAARASTASFSGTVESAGDYYAYYPYTTNGVGNVSGNNGAKVDLPANQYPTATSFDGSADIMLSKQFNVTGTTPTVDNLEFARLGAVVKIVLIDSESIMSSQHPSTVSMTAASNLAGRVLINMENQCLEAPYYNETATVTANYTSSTKYEINGTNATYLIVVPQVLAAGSTLTIAASTEAYSIEKVISVPAGGIDLQAGKITTLNITLTSAHITSSTGAALPFNDDFSWQTATGTNSLSFSGNPAIPSAKYSASDAVYQGSAAGVARLSTSSKTGYLTTVELNLSSAFYVHVNAKAWNGSELTKLKVIVDEETPVEIQLKEGYDDYYVNCAAATSKSKVKITTEANKRAYIKAIDVISGTYVFPPVINVTTDNPMDVANTADSHTIEYTIDNPNGATLTAALKDPADTWVDNIDYSTTTGEVSFDVAAQSAGAPARSAVIVLSYTGADDVEVTVNQAAGAGGTSDYTVTWTATSGALGNSSNYITSVGGTAVGNINTTCETPSLSYSWSFTRTLVQLKSGKTDYLGWSSNHIQVGSGNALNAIEFTTSNIPGTIKSISVVCYGNAHEISASVNGTSYIDETTLSNASDTYTGTGTANGAITISITNTGTTYKAFYIKSISVTYNN